VDGQRWDGSDWEFMRTCQDGKAKRRPRVNKHDLTLTTIAQTSRYVQGGKSREGFNYVNGHHRLDPSRCIHAWRFPVYHALPLAGTMGDAGADIACARVDKEDGRARDRDPDACAARSRRLGYEYDEYEGGPSRTRPYKV
jgi:hypothetical protein